jgi:hypothetical protein
MVSLVRSLPSGSRRAPRVAHPAFASLYLESLLLPYSGITADALAVPISEFGVRLDL